MIGRGNQGRQIRRLARLPRLFQLPNQAIQQVVFVVVPGAHSRLPPGGHGNKASGFSTALGSEFPRFGREDQGTRPVTADFEVAQSRQVGCPTRPRAGGVRFGNHFRTPRKPAASCPAARPPPSAAVERRGRERRAEEAMPVWLPNLVPPARGRVGTLKTRNFQDRRPRRLYVRLAAVSRGYSAVI